MISNINRQKPKSFFPEESKIITIEFTPRKHLEDIEYSYSQPKFRFFDEVAIKDEWQYYFQQNLDLWRCCHKYHICAMELAPRLTASGRLIEPPCWKYGISYPGKTIETEWFEEEELMFFVEIN